MGGSSIRSDAVVPLTAALALAAPVLLAFCLLLAFVVAEVAGASPFAIDRPRNVAETAAFGDAAGLLALIAQGQDVNARWEVRQDLLDSRGPQRVTAMQAAILMRRPEAVQLLLRRGARAGQPKELACLAQAVGVGRELPPSVFNAPDGRYYDGSPLGGIDALMRCGIPFE